MSLTVLSSSFLYLFHSFIFSSVFESFFVTTKDNLTVSLPSTPPKHRYHSLPFGLHFGPLPFHTTLNFRSHGSRRARPATMHSGSSNSRDNRRSSRRYTPRHNDDPYNRGAETSESSAAMQPGMSSVSHTFSESSLSYAPPDSQNYAAGDYSQMPTWSTNDYYGFPESHGSTHDYGLGFPSAEGTSSSYFNSAGPSLSYGENVTESSEHHNMYGSDFQSGQNISDAAFDISAFEMPTRTLTQATAPISSADTFDGSTVQ